MNRTILVVDDDAAIAELITDVLEEEGYTVQVASNGAVALKMIAAAPPALLLLDLTMPVVSGDVVITELATSPFATIPIVAMTAARVQPESLRVAVFLPKPFAIDDLVACVTRFFA